MKTKWWHVCLRAQLSVCQGALCDWPLLDHMTVHPLCDCCCLAAMTTKFKSWMNGFTEEEEAAFLLQSASEISEMHRILGRSQSKCVAMLLLSDNTQKTNCYCNVSLVNVS